MNFTFKQFEDAAKKAGMLDTFSQADLELARNNPSAGMSILNYKIDYVNAPSDEARALANAGANKVRSSYGNYQGGADGSGYYLEEPSPIGYNNAAEKPNYSSAYGDTIKTKLNELLNKEAFSYDPENDQLYSSYKKQYTRESKRATDDAIGTVAVMSGGVPSTYAATAGAQAGNYYASQMADKIPELYEMAYNKYVNDIDNARANIDVLSALEQAEYNKYLNELNQYNNDRTFGYGQYVDEIDKQTAERAEALEKAIAASQYGDFTLLKKLGITPDAEYLASLSNTSDGTTLGGVNPLYQSKAYQDKAAEIWEDAYENGNVVKNKNDYDVLVNVYGQDAVSNAGITYYGIDFGKIKTPVDPLMNQALIDESTRKDYDDLVSILKQMEARGDSKEAMKEEIRLALEAVKITPTQATNLANRYAM